MENEYKYLKVKLVLGSVSLISGFLALIFTLFHWVEHTRFYYLLGEYARYVCAFGGICAIIFGSMLINEFLVLKKYVLKSVSKAVSKERLKINPKEQIEDLKHKLQILKDEFETLSNIKIPSKSSFRKDEVKVVLALEEDKKELIIAKKSRKKH